MSKMFDLFDGKNNKVRRIKMVRKQDKKEMRKTNLKLRQRLSRN